MAANPESSESVGIKSMHVENGKVEVETVPAPEAVAYWVESFRDILEGASAPNYVEMQVKMADDLKQYVVTIQRHEGKTPHEMRQEAEAKLERIDEWARSHIEDPSRVNDEPAVLAARAVRAILRSAS